MAKYFDKVKIAMASINIRKSTVSFIKYNYVVYYFIKIRFCASKVTIETADLSV